MSRILTRTRVSMPAGTCSVSGSTRPRRMTRSRRSARCILLKTTRSTTASSRDQAHGWSPSPTCPEIRSVFPLAERSPGHCWTIGTEGMACPVEIEFAVDMTAKPMTFGFLQIRPIVSHEESEAASLVEVDMTGAICMSPMALGNGRMQDICDIVYVKPETFDAGQTQTVATELGQINAKLVQEDRKCVLIGFGRWGSSDRWLGIPVSWDQIYAAQVMIETTLEDFVITPSQGTHFFQNLTSLGVGYFTIDPNVDRGFIDWDWLNAQPAVHETQYTRHIRTSSELDIRLDGRHRLGVIFPP